MAAIRLLSESLINRIAAGEVVERPASVLKELLENALDAGATRIEVDTEAGGRKRVMVTDNGEGMSPDDLLLAVERHATSKLTENTDLLKIDTLGFRGEALPSIGAVSRLTITSSAGQDGQGRRIHLSGGRLLKVEDAARDRGTTVDVMDLFFNVPARRKFLKTVQTESAHLMETAQRYALGRSDLALVYRSNGQEALSTSPREDDLTRVARVLGRETARNMRAFSDQSGELALAGFLGPPDMSRSRPGGLYLFVNGRPVTDRLLTRAVIDAYRERLPGGRYPAAVIFLTIPPEQVDVNVHPAKAEVRFRQPGDVFRAASDIMARALGHNHRPADVRSVDYASSLQSRPQTSFQEAGVWESRPEPLFHPTSPGAFHPVFHPRPEPSDDRPDDWTSAETRPEELRPIGQLHRSYLLAQSPEGLYIVDQHAAHERIIFERLKAQLAKGSLPAQSLLLPDTLELTPVQADLVQNLIPALTRFGFELEPFGGQTFVLRSVPVSLTGRDHQAVLNDILSAVEGHRPEAGLERFEETLLSSLACHGAVKAGEEMTLPEMDRLLTDLDRTQVPTHCPHGRPLIFHLSRHDIEKRFKRA